MLDTAKGADLGSAGTGGVVLDFNFAYHPSCVHSSQWSCPLAPPENHLRVAIEAGERLDRAGVGDGPSDDGVATVDDEFGARHEEGSV